MSILSALAGKGDYNDYELVLRNAPSGFWLYALAAAVVVVIVWAWLNLERVKAFRLKAALFALRLFGLAVILFVLLQPAIELRKVVWRKTHIEVLVDDSRSMSVNSGDSNSRFALAKEWVRERKEQFAELSQKYFVDFMFFSNGLKRSSLDEILNEAEPKGPQTGIYVSLSELASRFSDEELSGIILLSDGADNMGFPDVEKKKANECVAPTGCNTPIFAVYPDAESEFPDLAISSLRYDDFAFVHNTITIEVELRLTGFPTQNVPVVLKKNDRPLISTEINVKSGGKQTVTLAFKPTEVGRALYEVGVPILQGEKIVSNNKRVFMLKVIRDKVRVLQVSGRPDWDERFLRQYLKKNPNVDLISFFILRTNEDMFWVQDDELSLIPFPTDELFNSQLHTFDLVIFQNFTYRGYQMAYYLKNIADFVKNGGAFAMIGGDNSFGPGGYAHTEIEEILPVKIIAEGKGFDEEPFLVKLTAEGEKHPITALERDKEKNVSAYSQLPKLLGLNYPLLPYDDAVALAVHPTLSYYNKPAVVVAIRRVGEGRSMAVSADSLWLWNFEMAKRGEGSAYYNQFWSNAIRWLIKDPDMELLQITAAKDVYKPGETITLSIRALDENFLPAAGKQINVSWITDDGTPTTKTVVADGEGLASVSFDAPSKEGALTVKAAAEMSGGRPEESHALMLIDEGGKEMSKVEVDKPLMNRLAGETGGKAYGMSNKVKLSSMPFVEAKARQIANREDRPLWDNAYIILIAGALFTLEWWIRKRKKLP